MKKFLTILLALTLALSMAIPVFAEEATAEAPKNYAENLKWIDMSSTVEVKDGVVTATNIKNAWSSPMADILPSIKKAIGTEDEVDLVIVVEMRATFTEGNEGEFINGNVLLRADNNLSVAAGEKEEWTELYEESLDGEEPFFDNPDGNIRHHFGGAKAEMTDDEWYTLEIPITVQKIHVENTAVKNWNFCFDGLTNPSIVNTIELKNFGIYLASEYESTAGTEKEPEEEKPVEEPEEKPVEKPQEATPTPTAKPTAKPAVPTAVLQTPDLTQEDPVVTDAPKPTEDAAPQVDGSLSVIIIWSVAAAVVIIGVVAAIIISNKKKSSDK